MNRSDPTNPPEWTDEMLMAYVDGELDADTAERIAAAIAAEPELARRADGFRLSGETARAVYGDILSASVPDRLIAAILGEDANVVPLKRRQPLPRRLLPLAASLLVAAAFGGGFWLGGHFEDRQGNSVAALLASEPSGSPMPVETDGESGELTILGSYEVPDGLCRVFHIEQTDGARRGIGCDHGAGFRVEMTVADGPASESFSPASERATELTDAYLDAVGAGAPLSAEEEARRLSPTP